MRRAALALTSLTLTLLALEAVGRLLEEAPERPPFLVEDAELGWALRPESRMHLGGQIDINALGLRGPEPSGGAAVAVFGDSTVFGHHVRDREGFVGVLRDELDVEVLNGGVPGYQCTQARGAYERLREHADIELAVLYVMHSDGFQFHRQDLAWASAMPDALRTTGIGRVLSWATSFKLARTEARRTPLNAYRACLEDFVQAQPSLLVLPLARVDVVPGHRTSYLKPYREVMREVARDTSTPLADAALAAAEHGSERLLMDEVHPSVEGHALVAEVVLDAIAEHGLLPGE